MFKRISRSWEFAKIAYGIIWDFKKLMVFPILSTLAGLAVLASFVAPLWGTGTLQQWMALLDGKGTGQATTGQQVVMWTVLFLFYFCSYFVIVFFNTGLTACAMKVISGEAPTVGDGLATAGRRLPQIVAWAFVSAVVGVLLRAIENVNDKLGRIVAALLGTAWGVMTYFVVPVLVIEGVGPIEAIKRSVGTLKATWGEAVVGNVSMGLIAFLLMLPVFAVIAVIGAMASSAGSTVGLALTITAGVALVLLVSAFTAAADVVFKALLYNYATGRSTPAGIDAGLFHEAFRAKK